MADPNLSSFIWSVADLLSDEHAGAGVRNCAGGAKGGPAWPGEAL